MAQNSQRAETTAFDPTASTDFDEFVYLVSHDLRNSLRALAELPAWIEEDLSAGGQTISKSLADSIVMMKTHASRADQMVIDLLTHSRIGRDGCDSRIGLEAALANVVAQLVLPDGVEIRFNSEDIVLPISAADTMTLLSALVSNAIKHRDGQTSVVIIIARKVPGRIIVQVSDDGPGIDPKYHDKARQPMSTLQPRDQVEGSGMGLAFVDKIMRIAGGSMSLDCAENDRGTVVKLSFPQS